MISLRKAIDEHCKSCIYDECQPGYWRNQVAGCTVTVCALHPVRPVPQGEREKKQVSPETLERLRENMKKLHETRRKNAQEATKS